MPAYYGLAYTVHTYSGQCYIRKSAGSSSNSTGTGGISIGRAGAFILSLTIRGSLRPSSHTAGARGRASHTRTGLDFSFVWDNLANLLPGLWIIQIKLNYGLIWILDCPSLNGTLPAQPASTTFTVNQKLTPCVSGFGLGSVAYAIAGDLGTGRRK